VDRLRINSSNRFQIRSKKQLDRLWDPKFEKSHWIQSICQTFKTELDQRQLAGFEELNLQGSTYQYNREESMSLAIDIILMLLNLEYIKSKLPQHILESHSKLQKLSMDYLMSLIVLSLSIESYNLYSVNSMN
jgi:hypothetical protein